jgi:murein L,D-transpeptidase YafK
VSRRRSRAFEAALGTAGLLVLAMALPGCGERAPPPSAADASVDHILIEKAAHRLTLMDGDRPVRVYRVSLGHGGLAPKAREGDGRTPEGDYRITGRNPKSAYHRSLRIGFPTPVQVAEARRRGVDPGGDIMIHGLPNGRGALARFYAGRDWTDGCVAVTDAEIEEIWRLTRNGASVHIAP